MCIATLFSVWFLATAFWQWLLEFFMSEHDASELLMNTPVMIASVVIYTALVFWYLVAKKRGELSRSGEHVAGEIGATMIRRRDTEMSARQLHNITEEMALAAGVPAPAVYRWPTPGVINAFAVGHTTADAAIFVSQGAIEALSRDEMQALIGHRMSQVLNGDMALNSRLASYLYAFRFAPRVAKWWLFFPTHDESAIERFKAVLVWLFFALWIGIALSIVTFPQFVGARLLQAAISRERQRLADASAIQFTRNPEALKGVLIKALALGTISPGTPMLMDDLAQTCFAAPVKRRYLDTHQTLEQRLQQLDAKLTRPRIAALRREAFEEVARRKEITTAELERQKVAAARRQQAAVAREKFVREVAAVAAVASARKPPPEESRAPVTAADDARASLIALLLDRQPLVQGKQFAVVSRRFGESSMPAVKAASEALGPLVPAQRTIALDKLLPALRELPAPELRRLASVISELRAADETTDVFEYALSRQASVFVADVLEPRDPHGKSNLGDHAAALRTVFTVVAQYGSRRNAAAAFEVGMKAVGFDTGPRFAPLVHWIEKVDQSLGVLESMRPIAKELLLEGLQATVKFDGEVVPAERELLRVIAASLHCPIARA